MQLEHTMGTRVGPTSSPIPRASSSRATPDAASRPKAEPPERQTACTTSTVFSGRSRSVSREAGAPPRTSTPPVAPCSATMTVHPVAASRFVKWPIRKPSMLLMGMGCQVLDALMAILLSGTVSRAFSADARPRRWAAQRRCRNLPRCRGRACVRPLPGYRRRQPCPWAHLSRYRHRFPHR